MTLTVNKMRVYVSGGKVYRCDGDYTKLATDLRYVVIPVKDYDIKARGRTGAKPTTLAKEAVAEIAINFPYFNGTDGALLGMNIVDGRPLSYETDKTRGRAELFGVGGTYGVALNPPAVVDFAVQGSPELLRNGAVVVDESLKRDQLSISASDRSQRTAVGIRANGDVVFVVSDGRNPGYDIGLTFGELALVFKDVLNCTSAINGDGGGSSILAVNGAAVNQAINCNNERGTGAILYAVKKTTDQPPKTVGNLNVVIDAGHGPNTAGKRTPDDSMREFHFNSVVARYVRDELAGYETAAGGKVTVKFTHADDGSRDVPLTERVAVANSWPADVFVSIHANAYGDGWNDANGIETYTAIVCSATSTKLAAAVQKALIAETGLRDRGVKKADFTVIAKTTMPAILAECGFMTNRTEAALLKSEAYRKKCAVAIVAGMVEVYGLKRKVISEPKPTEPTPVKKWDATLSSVSVFVNGSEIPNGHILEGTTYVPVRTVAEALGASVEWDEVTRTVLINK